MMLRRLLVGAAFVLSLAAGAYLLQETRRVRRANDSIPRALERAGVAGPGVVIVFQPDDCLGEGAIVRRWNALAAESGLSVRGLVIDGASPEQRTIFRDAGLRVTLGSIESSDAGGIGARLGYRRTPFAIVLDANGRVVASFPASQNVPPAVVRSLLHARG